jgi:hypothetical protein
MRPCSKISESGIRPQTLRLILISEQEYFQTSQNESLDFH